MEHIRLSESEYRFMKIIWQKEPISSRVLVEICAEDFGWKKSTTYTVLKRLELKGAVQNVGTIVTALIPEEDTQANESDRFMTKTFDGSLPRFLAAFLGEKKLSEKEAEESALGRIQR